MDNHNEMLDLLNKMKSEYYTESKPNMFFKNTQKIQCAETISKNLELATLLGKTAYILQNNSKNIIYIEYPLFKLFANPENYTAIVEHLINLILIFIANKATYEIHINLKGFTISAAERYKQVIQLFCNQCCSLSNTSNISFVEDLTILKIYHTPSVMESISRMLSSLTDPTVKKKLVFCSKAESDGLMQQLFQP
jgi:hypothetical protein